jgi:hypothetical protein
MEQEGGNLIPGKPADTGIIDAPSARDYREIREEQDR